MAQSRSKRNKKRRQRQKARARRKQAKQRRGKAIIEYSGMGMNRQLLLAEWLLDGTNTFR